MAFRELARYFAPGEQSIKFVYPEFRLFGNTACRLLEVQQYNCVFNPVEGVSPLTMNNVMSSTQKLALLGKNDFE